MNCRSSLLPPLLALIADQQVSSVRRRVLVLFFLSLFFLFHERRELSRTCIDLLGEGCATLEGRGANESFLRGVGSGRPLALLGNALHSTTP